MANLKNVTVNSTSSMKVAVGTNSQRYGSANGEIRYNTDRNAFEVRRNASWRARSSIVRNGMVLHLDPGHPESYPYWDTSGSLYDISGNGNLATRYGSAPTFANGAMVFSGNHYLRIITNGGLDSLDFRNGQTVMIWMKHSFTTGRRNIWNQAYGGYGTWTHESGNNINYYWGDAGGNGSPYSSRNSGSTSRNFWNCMCVTRSTSTVTWYNAGVLTASIANSYGSLTTTNQPIQIGLGYTGVYWEGELGKVLAYNRALTAKEVLQNYDATKEFYGF